MRCPVFLVGRIFGLYSGSAKTLAVDLCYGPGRAPQGPLDRLQRSMPSESVSVEPVQQI